MRLSTFCLITADYTKKLVSGDEQFFLRALMQAQFARGTTYPNPTVGAVIVKDGRVLAEGYTEPPGGMHAEKQALKQCLESIKGATLYVTLEPCAHFGRTAPCTDVIIEAGIKRVVYGVVDANPLVFGQGIAALKRAQIKAEEIRGQELRAMSHALIAPFKKWILKKRPYVVVKIATSADGFFARDEGVQTKITGRGADELVHSMRRASDAVLVGGNTARVDNPALSARLGILQHGRQPASIIVTATKRLPADLAMMKREGARTIVISTKDARPLPLGVMAIQVDGDKRGLDLDQAFAKLHELGFTMILVEAGPRLLRELLEKRLVDEVFHFRSREIFNSDKGPKMVNLEAFLASFCALSKEILIGDDHLSIYLA